MIICIICKEWELGKLNNKEALRNLGELIQSNNDNNQDNQHYFEVVEKILDKEEPFIDNEEELNWRDDLGD